MGSINFAIGLQKMIATCDDVMCWFSRDAHIAMGTPVLEEVVVGEVVGEVVGDVVGGSDCKISLDSPHHDRMCTFHR